MADFTSNFVKQATLLGCVAGAAFMIGKSRAQKEKIPSIFTANSPKPTSYDSRWKWTEVDAEQQQDQAKRPVPSPHRRQGNLSVRKIEPLLRDIPPGGKASPVQGFDWFRKSLLVDADGDYANDFLKESQMKLTVNRGSAAKTVLQSHKREAFPARVSGLTLELGILTPSIVFMFEF